MQNTDYQTQYEQNHLCRTHANRSYRKKAASENFVALIPQAKFLSEMRKCSRKIIIYLHDEDYCDLAKK